MILIGPTLGDVIEFFTFGLVKATEGRLRSALDRGSRPRVAPSPLRILTIYNRVSDMARGQARLIHTHTSSLWRDLMRVGGLVPEIALP
jgi:hypothetical protein